MKCQTAKWNDGRSACVQAKHEADNGFERAVRHGSVDGREIGRLFDVSWFPSSGLGS